MYIVETGIPIPDKQIKPMKYPFSDMRPADSFSFPGDEIRKVRSAATQYGNRHNKRYICLRLDDGSARCWRVGEI